MTDTIPTIAALRERLSIMDRVRPPKGCAALSLGLACLDAALPGGGLVRGGVHEFLPAPADAGCHGFVASILSGLPPGPILWCRYRDKGDPLGLAEMPYGPGLAALGLDAGRLILIRPDNADDALWALEEALRCPGLAAVVGDGVMPGPVAGRRLQLAAEDGQTLGILILPPLGRPPPSTSLTRWHVTSQGDRPAHEDGGRPRWLVSLLRARGGGSQGRASRWEVVWDDTAFRLRLALPLADGPVAAAE
ncbi:ImuA family protein [Niveispirillum lacus]|uniref:ImuA family protein n=1 Tax=Niveispirillum lacus TaxID=1981099 RepID=UPI0013FE0722|nr:ImuA protein [Niveispirillum lacus]